MTAPARAILGFVAAALAVLTFHQAMWAAWHVAGLMPPPYPTTPIPPYGVPQIVNLCFWGGLYGVVFGLLMPRLGRPVWLWGVGFGVLAALVGLLLVPAVKGVAFSTIEARLSVQGVMRSLAINGFWGLGLGLILPLLTRRPATKGSNPYART